MKGCLNLITFSSQYIIHTSIVSVILICNREVLNSCSLSGRIVIHVPSNSIGVVLTWDFVVEKQHRRLQDVVEVGRMVPVIRSYGH